MAFLDYSLFIFRGVNFLDLQKFVIFIVKRKITVSVVNIKNKILFGFKIMIKAN